jgi:hypothetical protein
MESEPIDETDADEAEERRQERDRVAEAKKRDVELGGAEEDTGKPLH